MGFDEGGRRNRCKVVRTEGDGNGLKTGQDSKDKGSMSRFDRQEANGGHLRKENDVVADETKCGAQNMS